MSWSLDLRNGDLVISGARLGQTTGAEKLVQDLRCALLETRGHDDMHPTFGSLIDGGRDDSGAEVVSIIGTNNWPFAVLQIDSEIRRIAGDYQLRQIERGKNDRRTYGESTLTNDELLLEVTNIETVQAQDMLMVNVSLKTAQGQQFQIAVPINESPILA